MKITVAIVEDDLGVGQILADWVSGAEDMECLARYDNAASALAHLPKSKVDVVLVDINLSGQSGINCVRELKPLMPETQFLMVTVYEDSDHIFDALKAGASGYLLKRTPRNEMLASIRQVFEGGSPMTSYIARKVVRWFQPEQTQETQVRPDNLSPREREVLRLLARGYSYKEIAETLSISIPTVTTHSHRIYQKLHVRSRAQAVALISRLPDL